MLPTKIILYNGSSPANIKGAVSSREARGWQRLTMGYGVPRWVALLAANADACPLPIRTGPLPEIKAVMLFIPCENLPCEVFYPTGFALLPTSHITESMAELQITLACLSCWSPFTFWFLGGVASTVES